MKTKLLIVFCILFLRGFSQLPNPGFESWTDMSGSPFPTGWGGAPFGVDTTTDATEGNYALLVWTWYNYAPGYVCNGNGMAGFGDFSAAGTAYTQKPLSLTGMYKFDTTNVDTYDSVLVIAFLKKYNTTTHMRDTVALGVSKLPVSASYIPFTVTINDKMPGTDPDSIVVIISSQRRIWEPVFATNVCRMPFMDCAYLYVDDLHLTTSTGTVELEEIFKPAVFPNPANEHISFKYKLIPDGLQETLTVFDNTGKVCHQGSINSISNKLKVKNFGRGMYHYTITSSERTVISKGKFIVTD
ncbi:MAG TPA: T9SS type A sorting domain-containing protein [Bacteroidia bacterium]